MYNPIIVIGYSTVSYFLGFMAWTLLLIGLARLFAIKKGRLSTEAQFDVTIGFMLIGFFVLGLGLTIQSSVITWLPWYVLLSVVTAVPLVVAAVVVFRHWLRK